MTQPGAMDRLLLCLFLLFCFSFLQVVAVEQCTREGDVFIRGGTSSTSSSTAGRVEYCLRPSSGGGSLFWAIVCNSTFRLNEAHVACRSDDSDYAAYTTLPGASFSQTDLAYQVEVRCGGYESSITECNVAEVSSTTCNVFVAAGMSCNTGVVENSVILVGSASDTEGYVMIYRSGWKFLAAQPSHWTGTHAQVVCRQLGYEGGVVPSSTNGYSLPTNPEIMQENFNCLSSARGLDECTNTQMFLSSPVMAAVSCSLSGVADGALRLSRGSTDGENQGILEIVFNGRYGSVCSSGFGSQEAGVACRQLGYTSGSGSTTSALASRPLYLSGLGCSGRESSLLNCPYTTPPGAACSSGRGVRVTCSGRENEGQGLSGGAIAGIVVSVVAIITVVTLGGVYHKQIKAKLVEGKKRVQNWWNNLSICHRTSVAVSSSGPSSSRPTASRRRESPRREPPVREPEPTTVTNPGASSPSAAEPEEPQNPQLSAEAPPTYRDADQFQQVTDEADLEKPPPYGDPVDVAPSAPPAVGGASYGLPVAPSYPPTGPTYPAVYPPTGPTYPPLPPVGPAYLPTYPPTDPAYPPTYPPTDPAYPPPPPPPPA